MTVFKVGDVVIFTRDSSSTESKMKKGDVGRIIKLYGGCPQLLELRDIHNNNFGRICEDGVKLVKITTLRSLLE